MASFREPLTTDSDRLTEKPDIYDKIITTELFPIIYSFLFIAASCENLFELIFTRKEIFPN